MIDHLQGLRDEVERVRAAVGDLDAPVPACPDWRVRDLVHHLGSVHRRFRRVADEGWMQRPPEPDVDDRPDADDDRVVAWAERQADLLLDALERLDPEAPRWNFSHGPQLGAFIPRRMHHETAIHRWDLQDAQGTLGTFDGEAASDGVLEYLEVYLPGSGLWTGAPAVVHTVVVDGPTIELELSPDASPVVRDDPHREPDAVVAGPPDRLLLAWWDREPLSALRRVGDPSVIDEVRRFART